ncbi:E3 ubiquitin-protein ligase COP1-like [Apium graveolens]|uniref:E3 ubiquitin-protein ligase COP1-like n=1 Tax=Apium graveolens TaxID=4045 RepID=UPI003D7B28DA
MYTLDMALAAKSELKASSSDFTFSELAGASADGDGAPAEVDKELLCPICIQMMRGAFVTACGHSFCYTCIITHLENKRDCPSCGHFLSANQLFPNFVLDKLLKKASSRLISKTVSSAEQFRQALQKGCEVSVRELDALLSLLAERKRILEQEEAERNMQILLDLLQYLRKQRVDELKEIQKDMQFVNEDINVVERQRIDSCRARNRSSPKVRLSTDNYTTIRSWSSSVEKNNSGSISNSQNSPGGMSTWNFLSKNMAGKTQANKLGLNKKDNINILNSQHTSQSGLSVVRKKRVHSQFNELEECYLQKRRQLVDQVENQVESNVMPREGFSAGLSDFQSVLTTFTRYSRMRVIAELRHGDLMHTANIVSSIEFDCDEELFATAGVSRSIKVFDYASVVNEPADVHLPVAEMSTQFKLSCLSWNKCTKSQLASSDYEGIVTVWDMATRQSVIEYEEHEKRAWSVDFSSTEPSMLVSGGDDCKVKVWCTKQESSVLNIDMKANICCVKYNPGSSIHVAVGSADHNLHYYDLRNTSQPIHVFNGHKKTVSYVKFLSTSEVASASTDSTLRIWDVKENLPVRTFKGHTNEKNFVGLSVNKDFIACGSETNEVFAYHKAISRPMTWHNFGAPDIDDTDEESASYFISSVCWMSDSPTLLAANSQGIIKVLVLAE